MPLRSRAPLIHLSALGVALACCLLLLTSCARRPLVIGSKAFAESWILGEALADLAKPAGALKVEHLSNMGSTDIVYAALKTGKIDVYPDYTGTISEAILKAKDRPTLDQMRRALRPAGIGISDSLGFNDGYAIAVARPVAERLGLHKISDLAGHSELRVAMTHEFLERKDGWKGLQTAYGLAMQDVRGIQHDIAYRAMQNGQIDVTDIYTTDPQIAEVNPVVLEDDRSFFPRYDCVLLYRLELPRRAPAQFAAMQRLIGKIDERAMVRANVLAVVQKQSQQVAAAALLKEVLGASVAPAQGEETVAWSVLKNTGQHLKLVGISLLAAALLGIPLGVLAVRTRWLAGLVLSLTGVLQTIPSLALLAFLIPPLGVGEVPALVALFLYSLLPIVRNTYTGISTIPPNLSEAAEALGLSPAARLFRISLPMASPSIMAGLKTSAIINVGTATLAALVGAGGLGEPILRGLQTLNNSLILQGAVPAALLALIVQGAFDLLDRVVIPKGLRLAESTEP